ncbi:hypothetical protein GCK32_014624 [Trichostrongylus colubriformis]|uniref:Uncharacterized protein n=1 Tax=Trichostrongylus colubriformis TaxID=6319 RepID=A0AAN8F6Y8_TRICO
MHLCFLSLVCSAFLFAGGYADCKKNITRRYNLRFPPHPPIVNITRRAAFMRAINRFMPEGYLPMKYNKTLEQEAEAAYNETLKEQAKSALRKPFDRAFYRFNVTIDMDKSTFKADREQAFMDALFTIQDTAVSIFEYTFVNSAYTVNMISKIAWSRLTQTQCDMGYCRNDVIGMSTFILQYASSTDLAC